MARIFITGSTDGLGAAAAQSLLDDGHQVVLHARSAERSAEIAGLAGRAAGVAIGDLSSAADVRQIADQVNAIGRMDAVIHNAGVYRRESRGATPEGHATTLAVNTLAPYLLTGLIERPDRLVYLSSGLHRGGEGSLADLDWTARRWDAAKAYAESKLHAVALAALIGRRWPGVFSNAVDPGWVRTKMGGPTAPVDLATGARTQVWLAASDAPDAHVTGGYWHDRRQQAPAAEALDPAFQDDLAARLAELTGLRLF
ncbi:MAG TPA: SDR family NAD(P)-dependent oxidoreductase [Caulobacteraceae bacterium]|nr:SDR family NAD(P)-dependent oxidoreductase [Caulobacteraceae bacterium]